jgi:hypothetical protein
VGVDNLGELGAMVKASGEAERYGALKRVPFIAGLVRPIAIACFHMSSELSVGKDCLRVP